MKSPYLTLQPSEQTIVITAVTIYAAYISAGRVEALKTAKRQLGWIAPSKPHSELPKWRTKPFRRIRNSIEQPRRGIAPSLTDNSKRRWSSPLYLTLHRAKNKQIEEVEKVLEKFKKQDQELAKKADEERQRQEPRRINLKLMFGGVGQLERLVTKRF